MSIPEHAEAAAAFEMSSGSAAGGSPVVNTHVHLPPNFSAFDRVGELVAAAGREGVAALGASNYSDFRIYGPFADACRAAGILPLFGLEVVSVQEELRSDGVLVNDPDNPGRTYLCGKAIGGWAAPRPAAAALVEAIRRASDDRIRGLAGRLAGCFREAGFGAGPHIADIVEDVAARNGVPAAWVVLQERHLALAFQEAVFRELGPSRRVALFERLFGDPPVDPVSPLAVADAIRSRLMKAGRPAFVPEAAVSFEDANRLVLELDGIPCYPTLADGATPVCPWEDPPEALAERLVGRGIHLAELIPPRNRPNVVDAYVGAFRAAGILVLAGTEHNTRRQIPFEPLCADGARPSPAARAAFREGTFVVAAHQHLVGSGRAGYVDREGRLNQGFADGEARIRWFAELGAALVATATAEGDHTPANRLGKPAEARTPAGAADR